MGFNTINKIAEQYEIEVNKKKFQGLYGIGKIENEKVILLKPQTYMNLSGQSVREILDFYKIEMEELIVVYDDIDINPGLIKIRKKGSSGGHNGMKSIIHELDTDEFTRVRVGIGAPKEKDQLIDYVIGAIPEEDKLLLEQGVTKAKEAVVEIVKNGVDIAMNKYN